MLHMATARRLIAQNAETINANKRRVADLRDLDRPCLEIGLRSKGLRCSAWTARKTTRKQRDVSANKTCGITVYCQELLFMLCHEGSTI